jgi:hypothetical protein
MRIKRLHSILTCCFLVVTSLGMIVCNSSGSNKTSNSLSKRRKVNANSSGNHLSNTNKAHRRQQKSSMSFSTFANSIKLYNLDEPDFDYKLSSMSLDASTSGSSSGSSGSSGSLSLFNSFNDYANENYYDSLTTSSQSVAGAAASSRNSKYAFTVNITAILGHNILLPCAVRNLGVHNILWLRVRDGDVLAFDDMLITLDQRFKLIRKNSNESNLMIEGVKLSDSGEYACQINTPNVKSKFINLIILSMRYNYSCCC